MFLEKIKNFIKKCNFRKKLEIIKKVVNDYLEEELFTSSFIVLDLGLFLYASNLIGFIAISIQLFVFGAYITYMRSRG